MSTRKVRKESKFVRYMRAPIRVLARARDLYVKSLTNCAGHMSYENTMGCPGPQFSSLPRSFSANSSSSYMSNSEEDLRELIKVASSRGINGRIKAVGGGCAAALPRSKTVGFGRIDEDKPFEFEGDNVGLVRTTEFVPRSRSYAAAVRSNKMA